MRGAQGPVLVLRFLLGRQSLYFCRFFRKHLLARLRIAKEGFFKVEFYNLLSSRHPLLGGIILRDNIRASTLVLSVLLCDLKRFRSFDIG